MGKDEVKTITDSDEDDSGDTNKKNELELASVKDNESNTSQTKQNDDIRKIIKFKPSEEAENIKDDKTSSEEKKIGSPKLKENEDQKIEKTDDESLNKESLERKRAVLQSIKDFDFQIKKNQEDITGITQKLEAFSKDLDDLVSLYEIVSEQMNPFVGLSKVTKKKFDSIETFIKEIELMKGRLGDIESFAERVGLKINKSKQGPIDSFPDNLSDSDLDEILERSFEALLADEKIDMVIDEYIVSLKGENVNI